jgi:tetratricopeptide (TPR) repeat protein
MKPKPNARCSEAKESELREVAAEIASPETSARVLQHASQCDHCGPLLKQYLDDFSDELSPEIEALIDELPFSQPQWQREKAREIARNFAPQPIPWWKRFTDLWSRKWMPAMVGAMAALAGIGFVTEPVIMSWWKIRGIEKVIQSQPFEARFANMPPASFHDSVTIMGSEDKDWNTSLSEATQLCAQNNAKACQYEGRLLLLRDPKDSQLALKAFERARELRRDTASLSIDLGVAYLMHAKYSDTLNNSATHKYDQAIKELKKVVEDKTVAGDDQKTALFNLALAYELSGAHDPARSAWNEYLNMDSSSGWADRARLHLNKLRSKPQ